MMNTAIGNESVLQMVLSFKQTFEAVTTA
jgi:hypothetical protein